MTGPSSLDAAFDTFEETWAPRIVGRINDYDVKIAKASGTFTTHSHPETDEYFHCLAGELTLELPDEGRVVVLKAGDVYTVPAGVVHTPSATPGTRLLFFEPRGTENTGDADIDGTTGIALS